MTTETENRLLIYERLQPIHEHIIKLPGEMVLQCRPFRWLLDGQAVSHAYEHCALEYVVAENGLEIVCQLGDLLAIVRRKA